MNKFKLHQRVVSPVFGNGAVAIEAPAFGYPSFVAVFDYYPGRTFGYRPSTCENTMDGCAKLTPIGPYEGERVANAELGAGTIVETESGAKKTSILVCFNNQDSHLHAATFFSNSGPYPENSCRFFAIKDYGTSIKPLTAPEPQPAPATFADVERLIAAHVDEYHAPVKPAAPVIPEGWTAIETKPEYLYDVELLLKDGTQRYGFFNNGRCVLFEKDAKPVGTGKNCVAATDAKRTVVPASDVLAWRHITAEPTVPGGWNGGHPDDDDNVEIIFADGKIGVGYWQERRWFEFAKSAENLAREDLDFCEFSNVCEKPVIGWRVPQREPETFKRGERVIMNGGVHGTFVALDEDYGAVIMPDEGALCGGAAKILFGLYGKFVYAKPENLKREAKQ